jgi:hypothetical protein
MLWGKESLPVIKLTIMMNIDIDQEIGSCVFKLYYGDRYVIVKGKTLAGSIFLIEKGYAYFLEGGQGTGTNSGMEKKNGPGHKEGDGKNTFYFQFYSYIKDHPGLPWHIEMILESDNGYQLLKAEQLALNAAISDKKCLNNNVEAYLPKLNLKTRMYGWIERKDVASFRRLLKRK